MDDLWRQIREVFDTVVALPASERAELLRQTCGDDEVLRREVERLLRADSEPSFLEPALPGVAAAAFAAEPEKGFPAGSVVGRYTIVGEIGAGGMGRVYEARQDHPRRSVALKVLRGSFAESRGKRFELEAQVLAILKHPAIVPLYEVGHTPRGSPYFAMELVDGKPLDDWVRAHSTSLLGRLRLFKQVLEGVAHAHQKGIIHRDLKPSNILVSDIATGSDASAAELAGQVRILDFGLARIADTEVSLDPAVTREGQILGTLAYMSPEQAGGDPAAVEQRSDVYSLGVILFELLTDERPYDLTGLTVIEAAQQIQAGPANRPGSIRRECRGDLETIVMHALEKEPDRRYQSVSALAEDIRRYLEGLPLLAHPPSAFYQLRKIVARNRLAAASALVILLVIFGSSVAFALQQQSNAVRYGAKVDEFDMLANVVHLDTARDNEKKLYPAWPEVADAMQAWLEVDWARLAAARPVLVKTVEAIDARVVQGPGDRFLHQTLSELIEELGAFESKEVAGVRERLAWADRLQELSIDDHRTRWDDAGRAISRADDESASVLYRSDPSLELLPQMGLVPIGMNPKSKLWEFYHLRSAADPRVIPSHREDGTIEVTDDTGIVFVLLAGGRFMMGAQKEDPDKPYYDEHMQKTEGPLHAVTLSPFFLSRYELTQGQWLRLVGKNPSQYRLTWPQYRKWLDSKHPLAHPVEMVNWHDCRDAFGQIGLTLPTESQWEYGCRAGTHEPWWSGSDKARLQYSANIADDSCKKSGPPNRIYEHWDDGYCVHAPVGRFLANRFGIHDSHGNVMEWCFDGAVSYEVEARHGDGLRGYERVGRIQRVRGGAFDWNSIPARSTDRGGRAPQLRSHHLGVRPARSLLR